jgi:hypothetical protein
MSTINQVGGASAPLGVDQPLMPGGALADDCTSLLPEPMCIGGGAITQIAVLMTESGLHEEINSTHFEDAANVAIAKDDAARVAQMMDKANQDLGSALATGIGDIAGGALGVAGGFVDARSDPKAIDWSAALAGASKVMSGVGTVVSAPFRSGADQDDARAAEYQSASDMDGRAFQSAQNAVQAADDQIEKVQQMLQQIQQTQAETAAKAAGG